MAFARNRVIQVGSSGWQALAALQETRTVRFGPAASLARPGGNATDIKLGRHVIATVQTAQFD